MQSRRELFSFFRNVSTLLTQDFSLTYGFLTLKGKIDLPKAQLGENEKSQVSAWLFEV